MSTPTLEAKIYKLLNHCIIVVSFSIIVYYFHLYYWFFDLDNFFILYFALEGKGSVPFIAGENSGAFSQYKSNIYLYFLGFLFNIFSEKKLIFDLCSLAIFWTFLYFLFITFSGFFKKDSKEIDFSIFLIAIFLSYAPFGHWFFIESATPSNLAKILFISTLIVFFSPTKRKKYLIIIFLTLMACNTHASLIPTFILFFCSLLFLLPFFSNTEKKISLIAVYIVLAATFYGVLVVFLNEGGLHDDSFILGKTWSDRWIDTPGGKVLNASTLFSSKETILLLFSFLLGILASFKPEFRKISLSLRLFYLSGLVSWTVFHLLLFIPPIPSFLAGILTEVSLLRTITPILTVFKLITLIIVIILLLRNIPKIYINWFLLPVLLIFTGVNTKNIYLHSKENSAGIESHEFKEMVSEINSCCRESILVSDNTLSYVISPFVDNKVYSIMHNRMKFIIGWSKAHQATEFNKKFLENPILNKNKISPDKSIIILINNQKFGEKIKNNVHYKKLELLKENEQFTLFRINHKTSI